MSETTSIRFAGTVYKVHALPENRIRVTLDLDENSIMQKAQFAECQRSGVVLDVICRMKQSNYEVSENVGI